MSLCMFKKQIAWNQTIKRNDTVLLWLDVQKIVKLFLLIFRLTEMLLESLWLDDFLTSFTHNQVKFILGGAGSKHVHIWKLERKIERQSHSKETYKHVQQEADNCCLPVLSFDKIWSEI